MTTSTQRLLAKTIQHMKSQIRRLAHLLGWNKHLNKRSLSPIHPTGFHGDTYLLDFVNTLVPLIDAFIETGTNVGTTTLYMAKIYPDLTIYSCEPDEASYRQALEVTQGYKLVNIYQMLSPEFLYYIHEQVLSLNKSTNLYWLDAHQYGYKWPLAEEIRFITTNQQNAIIMIDDAAVPEQPQFQYAEYEGQICDVEYVEAALAPNKTYQFIHPNYSKHTSKHHPLVGVIIIVIGFQLDVNDSFTTRLVQTNE